MILPDKIIKAFTRTELIEGFFQSQAGNCVSIAAIKASLMAFGTKPVFAELELLKSKINVTMHDGYNLQLNEEELSLAKLMCEFKGDNILLLDNAIVMFAVMAKRAQIENNDNVTNMSYARAIKSLNDGEDFREGPKWLGLNSIIIEGPTRRFPFYKKAKKFLLKHEAGIGKSPKHAWFSSKSQNDERGKISKIRRTTCGAIAFDISAITKLKL